MSNLMDKVKEFYVYVNQLMPGAQDYKSASMNTTLKNEIHLKIFYEFLDEKNHCLLSKLCDLVTAYQLVLKDLIKSII